MRFPPNLGVCLAHVFSQPQSPIREDQVERREELGVIVMRRHHPSVKKSTFLLPYMRRIFVERNVMLARFVETHLDLLHVVPTNNVKLAILARPDSP